jgi:uncharacterized membrane protein YdbT with pleckstrin-like domain
MSYVFSLVMKTLTAIFYNRTTILINAPHLKKAREKSMVDDRKQTYNETKGQSMMQPNSEPDFMEETAAEVAEPVRTFHREENKEYDRNDEEANGKGLGWLALVVSIVSLFIMPVILGATGIILGFIARRRGAETLGAWAIGIGVVSIIIAMFVLPFYR